MAVENRIEEVPNDKHHQSEDDGCGIGHQHGSQILVMRGTHRVLPNGFLHCAASLCFPCNGAMELCLAAQGAPDSGARHPAAEHDR